MLVVLFFLAGVLCAVLTAFAYIKVYKIIRRHQRQVQTNHSAINMEQFERSIFTVLYNFAIFVLSYIPYLCCIVVFHFFQDYEQSGAALNVCAAVVFSSSFFSPLRYYWRMKETRDGVKSLMRKFLCKHNAE